MEPVIKKRESAPFPRTNRQVSLLVPQHGGLASQDYVKGTLTIILATKLAQRCNVLSCFEASIAMQKQENRFFPRGVAYSLTILSKYNLIEAIEKLR